MTSGYRESEQTYLECFFCLLISLTLLELHVAVLRSFVITLMINLLQNHTMV